MIVDSPGVGESEVMDEFVDNYLSNAFCFMYVINSHNAGGVQKDRVRIIVYVSIVLKLACVASVSVGFRSKERGTRVKDRAKNGASRRAGRAWGRKKGTLLFPSPSLFGSRFISHVSKTENPLSRSFFAPKPNINACYAGHTETAHPSLENITDTDPPCSVIFLSLTALLKLHKLLI